MKNQTKHNGQILLNLGETADPADLQAIGEKVYNQIFSRTGKVSVKKLLRLSKRNFSIEVVNAYLA